MEPGPRILVIDDDPAVRRYLRRSFSAVHWRVRDMAPGPPVVECIAEQSFDLVILDLDAEVLGGADILHRVRERSSVPIVALSSQCDERSVVEALESGADDVVGKPFDLEMLLARARSALRRTLRERGQSPRFVSGDLEVDLVSHRVWSQGRELHLSAKPYAVLRMLVESWGRVLTHEELLRGVWGPAGADRIAYLRVAIGALRRSLEVDPSRPTHIVTEPRVGYRLRVPDSTNRGTLGLPTQPARRQA